MNADKVNETMTIKRLTNEPRAAGVGGIRRAQFSIRDLLWLTLVVAMGLGWLVRDWQLREEVGQTKMDCEAACLSQAKRANGWRARASALEYGLKVNGWTVAWNLEASTVSLNWHADSVSTIYLPTNLCLPIDPFDPSVED